VDPKSMWDFTHICHTLYLDFRDVHLYLIFKCCLLTSSLGCTPLYWPTASLAPACYHLPTQCHPASRSSTIPTPSTHCYLLLPLTATTYWLHTHQASTSSAYPGWITLHWLLTTTYLRFIMLRFIMLITSCFSGSLDSVLELVLRDSLLDLSWVKGNLTAAGPTQEIDILLNQPSVCI